MKSVLVIDKPDCCRKCQLSTVDSCYVTATIFMCNKGFDPETEILSDCPLRNLPQPEVANDYDFEHYRNGVAIGWNRCLEKITGELSWKK